MSRPVHRFTEDELNILTQSLQSQRVHTSVGMIESDRILRLMQKVHATVDVPMEDMHQELTLDLEPIRKALNVLHDAGRPCIGRLRTSWPPRNPTFILDDPEDGTKAYITTVIL